MTKVLSTEKAALLAVMYASIERMNRHIEQGNPEAAESERHLQKNFRKEFEDFLRREKNGTETSG